MKKNVVKLNENTLRKMVAESVKKVLKEVELPTEQYNNYLQYLSDSGHISDRFMEFLQRCDFSAPLGEILSSAASSHYLK